MVKSLGHDEWGRAIVSLYRCRGVEEVKVLSLSEDEVRRTWDGERGLSGRQVWAQG